MKKSTEYKDENVGKDMCLYRFCFMQVRTVNLFYNNRTVQAVVELKNK